MAHHRRWRLRERTAISAIIGTVLMLGITVAAGTILWLYRPPLPPSPMTVQYVAIGSQTEPSWGDPTDCTNSTIYANCDLLPAFFIVFTSHSPENIPLKSLVFDFRCNGTSLVNGTFLAMEVVPGSGANPNAGSPQLGKCGTWTPSPNGNQATYFNRLTYFQQVSVGAPTLKNGDIYVVYIHPKADFCDTHKPTPYCPDDDFHGAPPWCFTVVGACTIFISYTGNPQQLIATIPVSQLSG